MRKVNEIVSSNKRDEKQTSCSGWELSINQEETSQLRSQDKAPCLLDHWHFKRASSKPHVSTTTAFQSNSGNWI